MQQEQLKTLRAQAYRMKSPVLAKADQAAPFAQFQARQASVQTILDMKKLSAFAFLRQEMQDTADCLNMGLYTMGDQEFKELYESRKHYFESADLACRVIQEQTEQVKKEQGYAWSSSQMQAGLRDSLRL